MASYLNDRIRIKRVMNAVAAGTTDQNSTSVDMQADNGYRGVLFVALFGTLTTSQVTSIHAEQSADNSSFADLAGTGSTALSDDDDNQVQVLDVYRPGDRYVRCVIDRGTANAVNDGILAIQYEGNVVPSTHDSTTVHSSEAHVSPAEGTI